MMLTAEGFHSRCKRVAIHQEAPNWCVDARQAGLPYALILVSDVAYAFGMIAALLRLRLISFYQRQLWFAEMK